MKALLTNKLTCTLVTLLAAGLAGAIQHPAELLVGARDRTEASVQGAVKGIGTVVGRDSKSGLYIVALERRLTEAPAESALLRNERISIAISADQSHVNMRSDREVKAHWLYLKEVARYSKAEKDTADWFGAYSYWVHNHLNKGVLDTTPLTHGAIHRDTMPVFQWSGVSQARVVSGAWAYVGPHNQSGVPDRTFDGIPPTGGRINAVAVNPKNDLNIFVASAGGGVWRTVDGGLTWIPVSDRWTRMQTSSVAVDPVNPLNVYVGTGDFPQNANPGFGVMKSTDGGVTWKNYGATVFAGLSISRIVIHPAKPNILLATAGRGSATGGVFRSVDYGVTWAQTDAPTGDWDGLDVSLPSGGVRTFWAAGETPNGANVYSSTNDGLNWTQATTNIDTTAHQAIDIACSKAFPNVLYIYDPDTSSGNHANNHIWKSTDGGNTWADIINGFPNLPDDKDPNSNWSQSNYNFYVGTLKVVNGATITDGVFIGLNTLAMSPDGGATWLDVGQATASGGAALTHSDQHAFCVDPLKPNTVFTGNDGGVQRTSYDPVSQTATFAPLNKNLFVTQFYHVAVHPTNINILSGGAQDNACPTSTGDINNWINPGGGDGAFTAYDPFNPLYAYNDTQSLGIFATTNGWATNPGTDISQPGGYGGQSTNFIPPIAVLNSNGVSPSRLFAGSDHIWSYNPSTQAWTGNVGTIALAGAGSNLRIIQTSPGNTTRIYTGSDDGLVYKTINTGASWTKIGAFGAPCVAIDASPVDPRDVLVALNQSDPTVSNLRRCANVDGTPVWVSVAGSGTTGLPPGVNVNGIARDPYAPATAWYVGTDVGVFGTLNAGATWANMTAPLGLPNVVVNDLKVQKATGYLYAATFGRGIWKIKLTNGTAFNGLSAPAKVYGGNAFTATITLTAPAPQAGTLVTFASDSSYMKPPASVVVPFRYTKMNFTVQTVSLPSVSPVTVHLTATQATVKSVATISIYPPALFSLGVNPAVVTGGIDNSVGTITLTSPAPANYVVTLSTSDANALQIPASVTVPAGSKTVTFQIVTFQPNAPGPVTITATRGNSVTTTLIVN